MTGKRPMNSSENNHDESLEIRDRFWEKFKLEELNHSEWEALCDGCGLCCLLKFQDNDDHAVTYTNVCCKLFDNATCRCKHYAYRTKIVTDCINLRQENLNEVIKWMPSTCAYKLIHEGRPLFAWHHLISNSVNTVHEANISAKGRCTPEYNVNLNDLELYSTNWANS